MTASDTLTLLKSTLQKLGKIDPSTVTREASLESLNIDSLMLLDLLFEVEDKLGIRIPNDIPNPNNIGELLDLVDEIRAKTASSN